MLLAPSRVSVAAAARRGRDALQATRGTLLADAGGPLAIYVASRAVQLALLWAMLSAGGPSLRARLWSWDGKWYLAVAEHGYPDHLTYAPDGTVQASTHAFFPLYPAAIRATMTVLGMTRWTAALTVPFVAGAVAAVLVHLLLTRLYSRRVGYFAVTVLFCQPVSIVFSMAYTEALLLALAAATLYALSRGAWLTAGVCGFLAGLTRPTGLAAAVAVGVAAAWAYWRHLRGHESISPPLLGAASWRPAAACALAVAGTPLFILYIGIWVGQWDGWFRVQSAPGWDSGLTGLSGAVRGWTAAMDGKQSYYHVVAGVITIAVLTTVAVAISERVWLPLTTYGLVLVAIAMTSSVVSVHVKPRWMVPAILPVVPVAMALARARARTAAIVCVGFAAIGLWHGAWALAVWTGSP